MRSTSGTTGRSPASPTAILAIILISYFMILLDNSVIFTGLPSIRAGLDLSPAALSCRRHRARPARRRPRT